MAAGLARSAGLVGALTMLSRLAGLVREMVFTALFKRDATDAFSIAFTIPNLMRRLLAEGILSTAFIPVLTGYLEREEQERRACYSSVLTLFGLVLAGVTAVGILAAPLLVRAFAPGYDAEKTGLTVFLTRVVFPHIMLVGLSSFFIGVLHTLRHFAAPALGPVLLNLGMIGGALGLRWAFPGDRLVGSIAVGVLIGGGLQLALQAFVLHRRGVRLGLRWQPKHPAVGEILRLLAPTLLGLGVYQINVMVSRALASLLTKGSVTYLYLSDRLTELPLGVVAVAYATVSLPTLARQAEQGDIDSLKETLRSALRGVLFLCIPAAVGLLVLREPVVATLFQRGRFTAEDVAACAWVFAPAAAGLVFIAALRNVTPVFLAMKDPKTPVKVAAVAFVLNAIFSGLAVFAAPLFRWFHPGAEAMGLNMANVCSSAFSCAALLWLLRRRIGAFGGRAIGAMCLKCFVAALVMGAALYPLAGWAQDPGHGWFARAGIVVLALAVAGVVYGVSSLMLGVREVRGVWGKLRGRLG